VRVFFLNLGSETGFLLIMLCDLLYWLRFHLK